MSVMLGNVMVSRESHKFQLFSNAVSSMQLDDIFSYPKLENESKPHSTSKVGLQQPIFTGANPDRFCCVACGKKLATESSNSKFVKHGKDAESVNFGKPMCVEGVHLGLQILNGNLSL